MVDSILHDLIENGNSVTRDQIAESKVFLLNNYLNRPEQMLYALLESRNLQLHNVIDVISNTPEDYGEHLGKCSSLWNSGVQALWELQGQGAFYPSDSEVVSHIDSFRLISGSSNNQRESTIHLKNYFKPTVRGLIQGETNSNSITLSNSDIYLSNLNLKYLPATVSDDLAQSSACFRSELYLPSIVMLGRAIEGAWISVANACHTYISDESDANTYESTINDEYVGVTGKINAFANIYSNKKYFGKLQHESGINAKKLTSVRTWSEQMLTYRNAIHPGAEPTINFNYETVSVILMSVKINFETLDHLLAATN